MKRNIGEIVIKYLSDKTETRNIIKCDDFFNLIGMMGFNDESQEVIDIIDYLEDKKTDINFHNSETRDFYSRFKNIERKVQMSKMLKGSKTEVQQMIEKVESITVKERPDWLDYYRNDDEGGESPNHMGLSDRDRNLGQDIIDRLTKEIKEKIDNEPGMTLEEIREQMNNEINNN